VGTVSLFIEAALVALSVSMLPVLHRLAASAGRGLRRLTARSRPGRQ
jgi:hypothetical protein